MNYELKIKNRRERLAYKILCVFALTVLCLILSSFLNNKIDAAINNTINYQSRITDKTTGLTPTTGSPTCVVAGAANDTCDFRARIWNLVTGGTATAGNNLMYEELFTDVEIGDSQGRFLLKLNSLCLATENSTHSWGTTVTSSTICQIFDDNADADSITGISFDRDDLFLEITFDPSGTWTTLASPPGGIETFSRSNLMSVPHAFSTQTLSGASVFGFVQLSPSSVQNTNSSTAGIWVRQQGVGDVIQLQSSGIDKFVLNNSDQLALSQTGITGGLVIGGDTNLYRSAANTLRTDDSFIVGGVVVDGLSNFYGDLRNYTADGVSTTTTGSGTSKFLTVTSTTGISVGQLLLVNGTTYVRVDAVYTSTQLSVTPSITWTAGQSVQVKTIANLGGSGSINEQRIDKLFLTNALVVGVDSNRTYYENRSISSTEGMRIDGGSGLSLTSRGLINLNTDTIAINKNLMSDDAATWDTHQLSVGYYGISAVNHNGRAYIYGGQTASNVYDTLYIYDYTTGLWSQGPSSGNPRTQHAYVVYNGNMYVWGGYDVTPSIVTTMDVYNFATNSWSTGTTGGTNRSEPTAVVYNDNMYVWGSNGSSFDVYNFAANSWSTLSTTGGVAANGASLELYNNKIYMVGGSSSQTKIYIFDFSTNIWTASSDSPVEKEGHTSTIYNNKIYIFSGINIAGTLQNTVAIYNISTNTWSTGVAGGTSRKYAAGTKYGGKFYMFLGSGSGSPINTVDIYNFGLNDTVLQLSVGNNEKLRLDTNNVLTVTGQALGLKYKTNDISQYSAAGWSTGTTGGTARSFINGVVYNDKKYIWGGCINSACTGSLLNTMDIYDLRTDTWSTGLSGGTARWGYMSALYNGKIYYLTGCSSLTTACSSVTTVIDIYDIASNTWSTGLSGGTGRGQSAGVLYNGKIYMWAGRTTVGNINSLDIYDIASNTWSTGLAGGTTRRAHTAVLVRDKIYFWGGFVAAVTNAVSIYDIPTNTWITGTAGGTARQLAEAVVYNGRMYIWGGVTAASAVNTLDIFDFDRDVWSVGTAGGTARYGQTWVLFEGRLIGWGGIGVGPVTLNTVDIYNLGVSNADDVFYIGNSANGGPGGKLFRFDATGRAYTSKQGGWFSVGADYAEYMHTTDTTIIAGDIVKLDPKDGKSILKAREGDNAIIGVISTAPGFVGNITSIENINNKDPNWKLMSMVGQVPVKVIGNISIGDKITASYLEGVGRKAEDGESNIGIAQENYRGDDVGMVSVLITRNNEGLNNISLSFGTKAEAGFRLSEEGKVQVRDSQGDWLSMQEAQSITEGFLWEQEGDNIRSIRNEDTQVAIGLKNIAKDGGTLQISKDLESRNGLSFVKVTASGSIQFNNVDVGFRVNESTKALEFRDTNTDAWKSLSGVVISRIRFNNDKKEDLQNPLQITGWGYLESNGSNSNLLKTINFPVQYKYQPIVSVGIIGESSIKPNRVLDCSDPSSINSISLSEVSQNSFNVNLNAPVETGKYYCYTWLAN